jgi:hypothetical protein
MDTAITKLELINFSSLNFEIMQKIYKIVVMLLVLATLLNQTQAQIANCCAECQADVKAISDKQVLLEKIEIPKGSLATNVSTNVYVSYRSGNAQTFWTNLAIVTAGVVVSTQLGSSSTPITAGENRTQNNSVSPAIPLGVSAALLPSIWKNRPRGVPQAGLYVQHRDLKGKLTQTWEQPISSEAKNSAELLTVAIDKPLTEGTLEVYLQNGSKNEVYYWGLQTVKNVLVDKNVRLALPPQPPKRPDCSGCGPGTHDDGWGGCATNEVDGGELDEVVVKPEPEPQPEPWNPEPWNPEMPGNGNGAYDTPGGGGGIGTGGGSDTPSNGGGGTGGNNCPSSQTFRVDYGRCLSDYDYGRLEVRRQECLYHHQQFNLDVLTAQTDYEIAKIACNDALNSSIIDALIEMLEALLLSGGDTSSYGDPRDIEDYVICRRQADEGYSDNIDAAYADNIDADYRLGCANLY